MITQCPKCLNSFENSTNYRYTKKYCSRICANSRNITEEHKQKTKKSIRKYYINQGTIYHEIAGPYTKVYLCTCKYSGKQWYSTTPKHVYPNLARNKKEYTYSCQFRFGISLYPKWFTTASKLIETYGWYSTPGSRKGLTNTNGISRDHLYSITDGWINQVPPEIIRHPANCSLIPHKENQTKHKKSKITLEELHQRIKEFDAMYPGFR